MGGMRRTIECISITEDDKHAYCGTRTGDVLKFKIDRDDIRVCMYVRACRVHPRDHLIIPVKGAPLDNLPVSVACFIPRKSCVVPRMPPSPPLPSPSPTRAITSTLFFLTPYHTTSPTTHRFVGETHILVGAAILVASPISPARAHTQYFNDPDTIRPTLAGYSLDKFGKGVRSVCCVLNPETGNTNTLVGGGDGTVSFINQSLNKV